MKKMRNLKIAVFSLICSVVLLTACSKKIESPEVSTGDNEYTELIEESSAVQAHIEAFKTKMEYYRNNPGIKSGGELYSAEEASTELESLLNYNFCYTGIECNQKIFVTSNVTMPLDDIQKINDPELMVVYYDRIIDTIQAQMGRVNYSNMKLLIVDLEVTGYDNNDDAIVSVGALIGNQTQAILQDDNWWYGENMGMYPNGAYAPEDAACQLMHRVDNALAPEPPTSGRYWFNPVHNTTIVPTSDPLFGNGSPDNYRDYKIFYATREVSPITNNEKHLPSADMFFYYNHYCSYASDYANSVTGEDYKECLISGLPIFDNEGLLCIYHDYTIFIGVKHLIADPEDPGVINIIEY